MPSLKVNNIRKASTFILAFLFLNISYCQLTNHSLLVHQRKIDSLQKLCAKPEIDKKLKAQYYFEIGISQSRLQRKDKVVESFVKAINIGKEINDPFIECRFTINFGVTHHRMGNHEQADERLLEGIDLSRSNKFKRLECIALVNYGVSLESQGRYDECHNILLQGLELAKEIKYDDIGAYYLNLSNVYFEKANYSEMIKSINEGLNSENLYSDTQSYLYSNKGLYFKSINNLDSAKVYYLKTLDIDIANEDLTHQIKILNNLSILTSDQKKFDEAYGYSELRKNLIDSVRKIEVLEAVVKNQIAFETQEKEAQIQLQELEIAQKERERNYSIVGILALAIFGLVLFILVRRINKSRLAAKELEMENKSIEFDKQLSETKLGFATANIEGQSKARKRIGRNLHDVIGSQLSAVKMYFSTLEETTLTEEQNQVYRKSVDLLTKTVQNLREISHEMSRNDFDSGNFINSIKEFASYIEKASKTKIQITEHISSQEIDSSVINELYWVISEILTNIHKHAEAEHVNIDISGDSQELTVTIEDDGIGFDNNAVKSKGIGLINIDNRVKELNGSFNIDSRIGRGSMFIIDIPLKETIAQA